MTDTYVARGAGRCVRLRWVVLLAGLIAGGVAYGQPAAPGDDERQGPRRGAAADGADGGVFVRADEEGLWVAVTGASSTRVFYRRSGESSFTEQPDFNARVTELAAVDGILFARLDGRQYWALHGGRWLRQVDLPPGVELHAWYGFDGALYGIVTSPEPGAFAGPAGQGGAAQTRPFDPGAAPLTLVRYLPSGWIAEAPAPQEVEAVPDRALRLGELHGKLTLFWFDAARRAVRHSRYSDGRWDEGPPTPPIEALGDYWSAELDGVPAVLVSRPLVEGGEALVGFRLLAEGDGWSWRNVTVEQSPLPEGSEVARYLDARRLHSDAIALALDFDGRTFVRAVRREAAPAEPALRIADIVRGQDRADRRVYLFQYLMLGLMTAIVVALFALRRSAMVTPALLPPATMLAPVFPRLLAFLVDLVPIALVTALVLRVGPQDGFRRLLEWTLAGDASDGRLPDLRTLLWWEITCLVYALYSFLMELFAGRSVGKLLLGLRVWGVLGGPASPGQLIVRNVFRLLELIPPLWLLVFVVVVSRNRQRVGDMFARTVVIRRDPNPPPEKPAGREDAGE